MSNRLSSHFITSTLSAAYPLLTQFSSLVGCHVTASCLSFCILLIQSTRSHLTSDIDRAFFLIHTAAVNWIFSLFFFKQRELFSSFWNTWLGPSLSHFEPQFDQQFISTWHWIAAMWLDNSRFVWTSIWSGVPNKVDDECRINVSTVTCHYCWCE